MDVRRFFYFFRHEMRHYMTISYQKPPSEYSHGILFRRLRDQAETITDVLDKIYRFHFFTLYGKDALERVATGRGKFEELGIVGVRGKAVDLAQFRPHRHLFIQNSDAIGALNEAPAERARGLKTHDQQHTAFIWKISPEVM